MILKYIDRIFFWRVRDLCWNYVGCRPPKKTGSWNISTPPRGGRKLVVGIWFGGVGRWNMVEYPVEKQSQAAVGGLRVVFTIPSQYSIYLV